MNHFCLRAYFDWLLFYQLYICSLDNQVHITLLVHFYCHTSRLKHMPLHIQKNIDIIFLKNAMNLDRDILYNFTYAISQMMRDDDVTPWRGTQKKHLLFFQGFD